MIKCRGGSCGGDCYKGGSNASLIAVGGDVNELDLVLTCGLGEVGARSAAVKVYRLDTACLKHDLCDLLQCAACRAGELTSVKDHHYDLALCGDTDSGTARTGCGVVSALGYVDLTVLDKHGAERRDAFLDLLFVFLVIGLTTDHCGAVLKDSEEAGCSNGIVLNAVHYNKACGHTGSDVVACAVGGYDGVEVLIELIAVFIGHISVILKECFRLTANARHSYIGADGRLVIIVVDEDVNVVTRNVNGSNVVNYLLAVHGLGIVDVLSDTGSKDRVLVREDGVIAVCRGVVAYGALNELALCLAVDVIGNSVAAGLTESVIACEAASRLKYLYRYVGGIGLINRLTYCIFTVLNSETVVHKVYGTVGVVKLGGEVCFHKRAELDVALLILRDEVVGIHIAPEVIPAECTGGVNAKAVFLYVGGHALDGAIGVFIDGIEIGNAVLEQVANIARPTGEVCGALVDVRDIHTSEHMAKVDLVSVGKCEVIDHDILQIHSSGAIFGILRLNVACKAYDLLSCESRPVIVLVSLNAGTDKVKHKLAGISRNCSRVRICVALKNLEICHKISKVRHAT